MAKSALANVLVVLVATGCNLFGDVLVSFVGFRAVSLGLFSLAVVCVFCYEVCLGGSSYGIAMIDVEWLRLLAACVYDVICCLYVVLLYVQVGAVCL